MKDGLVRKQYLGYFLATILWEVLLGILLVVMLALSQIGIAPLSVAALPFVLILLSTGPLGYLGALTLANPARPPGELRFWFGVTVSFGVVSTFFLLGINLLNIQKGDSGALLVTSGFFLTFAVTICSLGWLYGKLILTEKHHTEHIEDFETTSLRESLGEAFRTKQPDSLLLFFLISGLIGYFLYKVTNPSTAITAFFGTIAILVVLPEYLSNS